MLANNKTKNGKERLNLVVSRRTQNRLNELKDKTDSATYAEVFKNALRLYDALIEEAEKGNEFLVRDDEGHITSYKIFLMS